MNFDDFFSGYVEVLLYTDQAEPIINEAMGQNIILAHVHQQGKQISVRIRLEDFKPFSRILRNRRQPFHIVGRSGLPFFISKIKRRKGLLVGSCFCIALLYLLLSFIWGYEVTGNERFKEDYIIALVQQYGLLPGAKIDSFDYDQIQEQFVMDHQDFSWVSIKPQGTTIQIKVKEKLAGQEEDTTPADLVAKADGTITELLVYKGTPVVKRGQQVKKGQIIIGGWDYAQWGRDDFGMYVPEGEPYPIRAKGVIRGEVAHPVVGLCNLEETVLVDTENQSRQFALRKGQQRIVFWGAKKAPYVQSRQEKHTKQLVFWQNYQLPWQIEETVYIEQQEQQIFHTREEAYHLAIERARVKLESMMSEKRKFVTEKIMLLPATTEEQIQVEVTWITEENIALLRLTEEENGTLPVAEPDK